MVLLDDRRCQPVKERLRSSLTDKLADANAQIATLMAFTAQLQRAAARLGTHTPDGPCDPDCGCTDDVASTAVEAPAQLGATPAATGDAAIACTLAASEVPQRLADWQEALRDVTAREPIDGGVRLRLPRGAPLAALATSIEAEQRCCRFFTFTLTVGVDAIVLEVTAPTGAADVVGPSSARAADTATGRPWGRHATTTTGSHPAR